MEVLIRKPPLIIYFQDVFKMTCTIILEKVFSFNTVTNRLENKPLGEPYRLIMMGGVGVEEWTALNESSRGSPCVINIMTNNGLREIAHGAGVPMSVMAHLWQGLDCMYRTPGAADSAGAGGQCVPCYHRNRSMVAYFASLERAKHPVVKSLPAPLFDGATVMPAVLTEALAAEWRLSTGVRGKGYARHHWCPDAAPVLFGTPDDGFSEEHAQDVILKAHKQVVGMMQERYRLPAQVEISALHKHMQKCWK
jgi:hypothetical protein